MRRGHAENQRDGPQLRTWQVRTPEGWDTIESHFCFDNNERGEGLVFRRYIDDNPENKTRVVAAYANGYWQAYKELENG